MLRPATKAAITRYRHAVEAYAFKGTIPYDSEAAIQAHAEVEREFDAAYRNLVAQITKEKK